MSQNNNMRFNKVLKFVKNSSSLSLDICLILLLFSPNRKYCSKLNNIDNPFRIAF